MGWGGGEGGAKGVTPRTPICLDPPSWHPLVIDSPVMLRTSLPPTPRDVVESITSVVRPQRWEFEKCMELLHTLRRRPPESDFSGRRADTPDERLIGRLLTEIRASLPALSASGLVGAATHLEAAFQHCQVRI